MVFKTIEIERDLLIAELSNTLFFSVKENELI